MTEQFLTQVSRNQDEKRTPGMAVTIHMATRLFSFLFCCWSLRGFLRPNQETCVRTPTQPVSGAESDIRTASIDKPMIVDQARGKIGGELKRETEI